MNILKGFDMDMIKWLILLVTIGLSVMDFYIRRIPNSINVGLFSLLFLIALLISDRDTAIILKEVSLVALVSYGLFFIGALGGGDCKYLIAISPIIPIQVLSKVTLLAMGIFLAGYLIKEGIEIIQNRKALSLKWSQMHRMPFIWSLVPGIYLFGLCAG